MGRRKKTRVIANTVCACGSQLSPSGYLAPWSAICCHLLDVSNKFKGTQTSALISISLLMLKALVQEISNIYCNENPCFRGR